MSDAGNLEFPAVALCFARYKNDNRAYRAYAAFIKRLPRVAQLPVYLLILITTIGLG